MHNSIKYKELISDINQSDAIFIKSLFDSYNIRYCIQGGNCVSPAFAIQPTSVMVDETQYKEAKDLLKDFKKSEF